MTLQDREYDEILSRVLHSTLDAIDPAGDGLSKIQQRIAEPWLKRQWSLLIHESTSLGWLIFVRAEPRLTEARSSLASIAERSGRRLRSTSLALAARARVSSSGRHKNSAGHEGLPTVLRKWLGPTMAWLRPALAVGGAVVLVVVGVFAVGQAQQALNPSASSASPLAGPGFHATSAGHSRTYGQQSSISLPGETPVGTVGSPERKHGTKPSATVNASPARTPCPSSSPASSPSPSASASPSPSPSPSASASASPSPSPAPTTSPGSPSGGGSTSPGSGSSGGGSTGSGCGP
jgi:hypothetical protein